MIQNARQGVENIYINLLGKKHQAEISNPTEKLKFEKEYELWLGYLLPIESALDELDILKQTEQRAKDMLEEVKDRQKKYVELQEKASKGEFVTKEEDEFIYNYACSTVSTSEQDDEMESIIEYILNGNIHEPQREKEGEKE